MQGTRWQRGYRHGDFFHSPKNGEWALGQLQVTSDKEKLVARKQGRRGDEVMRDRSTGWIRLEAEKGAMKVWEEGNERHRHFRRTKNRDRIEEERQ